MTTPGALAAYVTSHGFGHLNRTVAVLNRMPLDIPIVVCSDPDLFPAWHERLRRPAELRAYTSDSGAISPPGRSQDIDPEATIARARAAYDRAMAGLETEVEWLKSARVGAVLGDVPPVPLLAAKQAGLPAYALANFTWADIYAPMAAKVADPAGARALVAALRRCYRSTSALFRAEPALRARDFPEVLEVGMVVTAGRGRSAELRKALGLTTQIRLVYVYVGRYGQEDLGWEALARWERRGVHFVGFHPPPEGVALPNLHVVPADEWTGGELIASSDAAIAKAGYGTVCEAMVSGTPLIYPPRTGFAEHRILDRALRAWGGGIPVSARTFSALRLDAPLREALERKPGPPPFPADGAARVAEHLERTCRSRRG